AVLARRLAVESRELLAAKNGGLGWTGIAPLAACIGLALVGGVFAHGLLALGFVLAGAVGAAISLFAGMRIRQGSVLRERERALVAWKDEWIAAGNPSDGIAALSSLEGFAKAMEERSREKDTAEARARESAVRCETRQADLE